MGQGQSQGIQGLAYDINMYHALIISFVVYCRDHQEGVDHQAHVDQM